MKTFNEFKADYALRQKNSGAKYDQKELSRLWDEYKNPKTAPKSDSKTETVTQRLHRLRAEKKAGKDVKVELRQALKDVYAMRAAKKAKK